MANTTLFSSLKKVFRRTTAELPVATAVNEAGGAAYKFEPKHALGSARRNRMLQRHVLREVRNAARHACARSSRRSTTTSSWRSSRYTRSERAFMKDMPAALLVALSKRDTQLLHKVFDRVVDNGRVLRTMFR